MSPSLPFPWTLANGVHVAESSALDHLRAGPTCPRCGRPVTRQSLIRTDRDASGEDVYGWHYRHPCGASLLIVND